MPSNVTETREEQQMGLEKLGFGEEDKKVEFVLIFVRLSSLIGRDPLYLYCGVDLSHKKSCLQI